MGFGEEEIDKDGKVLPMRLMTRADDMEKKHTGRPWWVSTIFYISFLLSLYCLWASWVIWTLAAHMAGGQTVLWAFFVIFAVSLPLVIFFILRGMIEDGLNVGCCHKGNCCEKRSHATENEAPNKFLGFTCY